MPVPLGDILVGAQLITRPQLDEAVEHQQAHGGGLDGALVALGFVTPDDVAASLSRRFRVPSVDLARFEVDRSVLALIPPATAREHQLVPLSCRGATLTVAITDPTDVSVLDDIAFMTGCKVEAVVACETAVAAALRKYYEQPAPRPAAPARGDASGGGPSGPAATPDSDIEILQDAEDPGAANAARRGDEAPVVRLVNRLLASAIQQGASDVHVEPYDRALRIRFRIDGRLRNATEPPPDLRDAVTSRLKVMARLDITERRLPQDGRIRLRFRAGAGGAREIDLRVSCLPTLFGERIVLRLLDRERLTLDLTRLGFEAQSLRRFEAGIRSPWGMVLVTGPTGSGKTSTLYSSIAKLDAPAVNIMTVEDPVEFNLPGVNQVQIREQIGLTFAAALRSFLRQDPNVILVGEIRDAETAEVAVKAALTGHLVLSTLHTNDAPSTIARLLNMGVEAFLVAGSLNLVCAQRLVRAVCRRCAAPAPMPPEALVGIGFSEGAAAETVPRVGRGCDACNHTGYRGRIGLFEVMALSPALRSMILAGAASHELGRQALDEGMLTLRRSGLQKVAAGLTTVEEVLRETSGQESAP